MFTFNLSDENIRKDILPRAKFHPYPRIEDREGWDNLSAAIKEKVIENGEEYLNFDWPPLRAAEYMDYYHSGSREKYSKPYRQRRDALGALVLAECAEDEGRFIEQIINGIWCILEETTWVPPWHIDGAPYAKQDLLPHPDIKKQYIDLSAGGTGAFISWIYYFLKSRLKEVSVNLVRRIEQEIKRRILDPYLENDDFWWMGFNDNKVNNWNPWCNVNTFTAFLLAEKDQKRRWAGIKKILSSMEIFLSNYPDDGGCDEGPGYWTQSAGPLWEFLELLLLCSKKKLDYYQKPLIKKIGSYIYKVYICKNYFVNFADGSPRVNLPGHLTAKYGKRIADNKMITLGERFFADERNPNWHFSHPFRLLSYLFDPVDFSNRKKEDSFVKDSWLPKTEIVTAREKNELVNGFYLAAKGGHNDESHNHNDVGHFIVFVDGIPFLVDPGVGTYTAQTFSARRYEIWTMQSAYHNLPIINGYEQQPGSEFRAENVSYQKSEKKIKFTLDISSAYSKKAGIKSWMRSFILNRNNSGVIELKESYELDKQTKDVLINMMTPYKPQIATDEVTLEKNAEGLKINYEADLECNFDIKKIKDDKLKKYWGENLFRISFQPKGNIKKGAWKFSMTKVN